ncbi:Spherulation-specific family 4 [Mucidula mucida]|nr:Spherulation-specific family 4 [Mucidula mucida]
MLYSLLLMIGSLATVTTALKPTGILFPLYIYPTNQTACDSWAPIAAAITAHATLPFYLVINPASGSGSVNSQPDSSYQQCVAELLALGQNGRVLGYVATGHGNRASESVIADVQTYAQWSESYRPSGIFFDEAASDAGSVTKYTAYTNSVASSFSDPFIILNPGTTAAAGYYTIADLVVSYEDTFDGFKTSDLVLDSTSPASEQAVLLHTGPSTEPTDLVKSLVDLKLGGVFITDFPQADAYSNLPSYWAEFSADVDSSQGSA